MTETEIQRAIVVALEAIGVWVIRTGVSRKRGKRGTQSGEPGFPDLYLPGLGHLEVKRPGEALSPEQITWHARAKAVGVRVRTVDSAGEAERVVMAWRDGRGEERAA